MYNDAKYYVGSKWYDIKRKQAVELVYCRNNTTVSPMTGTCDDYYYIPYKDLGTRLMKLKPTREQIKTNEAIAQVEYEIAKLKEGVISVQHLIGEKEVTIKELEKLRERDWSIFDATEEQLNKSYKN